jgi:hypothetical protein
VLLQASPSIIPDASTVRVTIHKWTACTEGGVDAEVDEAAAKIQARMRGRIARADPNETKEKARVQGAKKEGAKKKDAKSAPVGEKGRRSSSAMEAMEALEEATPKMEHVQVQRDPTDSNG